MSFFKDHNNLSALFNFLQTTSSLRTISFESDSDYSSSSDSNIPSVPVTKVSKPPTPKKIKKAPKSTPVKRRGRPARPRPVKKVKPTEQSEESISEDSSSSPSEPQIQIESAVPEAKQKDVPPEEPVVATIVSKPQPIIRQPTHQRSSKTYRCNRSSSIAFGKRLIFQFFYGMEEILFSAKAVAINIDHFVVQNGPEVHLKDPSFRAYIQIEHKKSQFTLHDHDQNGQELCKLKFNDDPNQDMKPRSLEVTVTEDANTKHYHNLEPRFNERKGTWQLDFHGRFVLKSVKNCILIDDTKTPQIVVRRTTKTDLEVECFDDLDPLCLFTIAIGSFVAP